MQHRILMTRVRLQFIDYKLTCCLHAGSVCSSLGGIDPALYKMTANGFDDDDETGGVCHVFPEGHIGRVRLGVHYQRETERLTVKLIQARNLPSRHLGTANACDPFVRCALRI
jgi:hypothetical protein